MADRRVLLIDPDTEFQENLARALQPYGIEVLVTDDHAQGAAHVAQVQPELVVIAVDLPEKVGYSTCNKVRRGDTSKIPVILVTASVPAADFEKHKKLPKGHADDYLDKRALSLEEILGHIDALIAIGQPAEGFEAPAVEEGGLEGMEAPVVGDFDDATSVQVEGESDQALAGLGDGGDAQIDDIAVEAPAEPGVEVEAAPAEPTVDTARLTELEEEVRALKAERDEQARRHKTELEEAKRAAAPAPAAPAGGASQRDILNLRTELNKKDKEILSLKEAADDRDRQVLEKDERMLVLEGELVTARESLDALTAEKTKLEAVAAEAKQLHEELEALRLRLTETQASHEAAQAELRKELEAKAAAEVRAARDQERQELAATHADAFEKLREELGGQHAAALAGLRDELEEIAKGQATAAAAAATTAADERIAARERELEASRVAAVAAEKAAGDERVAAAVKAAEEAKQETLDLNAALSTARTQTKAHEDALAAEKLLAAEVAEELRGQVKAAEARVGDVKTATEELERRVAGLEEQLLAANQKLKSGEAVVHRAKKAMAVALTLLDQNQQ